MGSVTESAIDGLGKCCTCMYWEQPDEPFCYFDEDAQDFKFDADKCICAHLGDFYLPLSAENPCCGCGKTPPIYTSPTFGCSEYVQAKPDEPAPEPKGREE